jgi:hypothetical protein
MTRIWVVGCWVNFKDGAAHLLVSYDLSCATLLRFFHWGLLIFLNKGLCEIKIKSCDLNLEFCRLHWKFNLLALEFCI